MGQLMLAGAAASGGGSAQNGFFLVGMFLWLASASAASLWFAQAQRDYLRLYRERLNPEFPLLPEELAEPYLRRPAWWLVAAPGLFWRLRRVGRERHADPAVERAPPGPPTVVGDGRRRVSRSRLTPCRLVARERIVRLPRGSRRDHRSPDEENDGLAPLLDAGTVGTSGMPAG